MVGGPSPRMVLLLHNNAVVALIVTGTQAFPTTQGQLIRDARGTMTQAQFARALEVDRSCLSRYESEQLGAPTTVLNHCLRIVAGRLAGTDLAVSPVDRALRLAREAVVELEALSRLGIVSDRRR